MSFITTYCSHCFTRNRLPITHIDTTAKCGQCKAPLFSQTPCLGRAERFDTPDQFRYSGGGRFLGQLVRSLPTICTDIS